MATTKQQHYRRLMKEQKAKLDTSVDQSKVDHPLAKYVFYMHKSTYKKQGLVGFRNSIVAKERYLHVVV